MPNHYPGLARRRCRSAALLVCSVVLTLLTGTARGQVIPLYGFTNTTAPYSAITGGTPIDPIAGGGTVDDGYSRPQTIPFAFPFGFNSYTSYVLSTNGWITFGAGNTTYQSPVNASTNQMIGFFAKDLRSDGAATQYSAVTTGTAPNRIHKIEGKQFVQYANTTAEGTAQLWLFENGNIEIHYGGFNRDWIPGTTNGVQVGLRGNSITDVRVLSGSWSAPVAGTNAADILPNTGLNGEIPSTNQVFRFTLPTGDLTPPTIGNITVNPLGGTCAAQAHTVSVSPTDASGLFSVELVYSVTGNPTPTTVAMTRSGTTYSATIPAQGSNGVSFQVRATDNSANRLVSTSGTQTYRDASLTINAGPDQTRYVGENATLTASTSLGGTVRITEFTLFGGGTGATNPYPSYITPGTEDFVEITNMGTGQVDLSNYGFEVQGGSAARTYSFPVGTIVPGREVLVLHIGSGTDDPSNRYYHTGGLEDQLVSGNDQAFLLTSPSGQVVDAVVSNAFTLGSPGSAADWSGAGAGSPRTIAGAGLYGADVNAANNWSDASVAPQSIGAINPGLPILNSSAVQWTGTGLSGTVTANPLVTPVYTTAGTYTYTAAITSGACTATDQVRVTVLMPSAPGAAFTVDRTSISVNDFISVTDQAANRPTAWRYRIFPASGWSFIANTSATSQNPYVQFALPGLYTIRQIVSNGAGKDSLTRTNYINVAQVRYCEVFTSPCTNNGYIDGVSIVGTSLRNRGTGCASGAGGSGYTNYAALDSTTATLRAGLPYSLSVWSSSTGGVVAWIDYNNDSQFDASEFINVAPRPNVPGQPRTLQFTIPFAAVPVQAQVGMRVRSRRLGNILDIDACTSFFDGETEDYTLTLIPGCNLAVPTVTSNGPICAGQNLTLTGGNIASGSTILWTGPNGYTSTNVSPQITGATAAASGNYTLTVSKAGCTSSSSVSVLVNALPTQPTLASNSPICAGQTLDLTATNLTTGASVTWTGPNGFTSNSATPQITNATTAAAGTYTATVSKAGCSVSRTITVAITTAPAAPTATGASRCGTGTLTLTASGAPTGGSYRWYTAATGGTAISGATSASYTTPSLTATTTYYVAALAGGGCEGPRTAVTATITSAPTPTLTAGGTTTFCQGGSVTLTAANGGTGASYQFLLNGQPIAGATGTTYNATQAGTYTVAATAGTCSGTSTGVVLNVSSAPAAPTAAAGSRCGTGTVTLTATGAPTGGTYRWYATNTSTVVLATGANYTTPNISGVMTYYVSAVSAGTCEGPRTAVNAVATNNPTPAITAGGSTTFCQGGSVTLTAANGATGATYQFLLNGQPITGATGATYAATQSGTYTVEANNGSGCTAISTTTVAVTVNPAASAAFAYASSTFCLSGSNPAPTISGTTGGTFSATPTGLSLNGTTGQIDLTASTPGTYTVTYAVTGQCPDTQSQSITLTTAPAAAFSYAAGLNCAGTTGSLTPVLNTGSSAGTFSATPAGLVINASSGVVDLAASQPGTYTVTNAIAASGSCAASSANTTLTLNAAPTATITAGGPTTFCAGDSVTLTANGGSSYLWSTGATTPSITVTQAGTYTVTASNAASCQATSSPVTVTVNATQSAAFSYGASTYCLGSTDPVATITGATGGTFSATAGLSINATTGEIDLANSTTGTYTVTYTVGLGSPCPTSTTQTVTLVTAPSATFSYATSGPLCAGATGTLTPTLGTGASTGTFSVTPAGLTIDPATGVVDIAASQPGAYTITNALAASGSCAATSATTTLTIGAQPTATITPSGPTTFCQGGSVTLNVGGTGSILWSTGATTNSITVTQSGTYNVTVSNAAGCTATSDVTVTVEPLASAGFALDTTAYCLNSQAPVVTITGTPGGTFSAAPAGLVIDPVTGAINMGTSAAGTYTVTYTVGTTCPDTQSQTITFSAPAIATFSYATASGCAGSTGTLAPTLGTGATAGTFSTPFSGLGLNPATGVIDLSSSQPGTYQITNTIAASGSCDAVTSTATVTINAQPVVTITGLAANYCAGDGAVTLAGTIDGTPVTGATGSFTVDGTAATQFDPSTIAPGTHTVVLTGSNGTCSGSMSMTVTVSTTPPAPTVTQAQQGGFVVLTSSAATGNLWYFNGTPIPGAIGQTYSVTAASQNGTYTVVASVNGCSSPASAPLTVAVTGVTGAPVVVPVSVYPNPTADGLVTVEWPASASATPLTVFDAVGRSVFSTLLPATETRTSLDLHALPTGVYMIRLTTATGTVVKRLTRE